MEGEREYPPRTNDAPSRWRDRVAVGVICLLVVGLLVGTAVIVLRWREPAPQDRSTGLVSVSSFKDIAGLPADVKGVYARDLEDRGLEELTRRNALSSLSINWSPRLRSLKSLERSSVRVLAISRVSSVDWKSLGPMPDLRDLALGFGTMIDDDVARAIAGHCPGLRHLQIYGNREVTDVGIAALAALSRLETIELINCGQLTAAGLATFATTPQLREMTVEGTQLDDASVVVLAPLKQLDSLDLTGCSGLSDNALARLAQQLPRTSVAQRTKPP